MAGKFFIDGASRSVTPWASQQIEVKQEDKKMTVQNIRDEFKRVMGEVPPLVTKREEYLEEENKRLKARLRRQRKELKRLNKQIRGPKKTDKLSRFQAAIDLFRMGSIDTFSGAVPKTIDNLGQACDKYGCAGTYQEANLMDDVNGILHCKWCNKEVSRWT